jgi:adenylate kinase family enzyme
MKICFTGSHGTGKSTLCQELTKDLPKVHYIKEIAREEIKRIGKLPYDMDDQERFEFQKRLLELQRIAESNHPNFISDRGIMDILAYSYDLPQYDFLLEMAKQANIAKRYDLVFYIPIEFPLQGDSERSPDVAYQWQIDSNLLKVLNDLKILTFKISGSVEDRKEQVLKTLHDFNLLK